MRTMSVSQELKDWAELAGYSLTADSADIFWNRGGEIRFFLREVADGWINVTCSDRLQAEYFYFAGMTTEVVEKYFFGWFGNTMRSNRGMPPLDTPISTEQLAPGYQIATRQINGVDQYVLIGPDGVVVAVASGGEISAAGDLVPLSIYLQVSPTEIMNSFKNDTGEPLFSVLD